MFKPLFLALCFVLILILSIFYLMQRYLIYFPDKQTPSQKAYLATDMTRVSIATADNLLLQSWYKPAKKNHATFLYLHGNAGSIGNRMPLARQLLNAGYGVLLLEYRGYGGNPGSPTEKGLYEDGRAAMQYLQEQGVGAHQVVLYGESLGTGVATKLAAEKPVCAVILQSPFTSLMNLARIHYPWLRIKPWDRFNSLRRMQKINAPVMIIHGQADQVVPYSEGVAVYNQAREPKKLLSFANRSHHDLWDEQGFSRAVIQFTNQHCQ